MLIGTGLFIGTAVEKLRSGGDESKLNTSTSTSSKSTTPTSTSTTKTFTASQIAEHSSRDDCWLIIDGGVYDVTDYLSQHPGGVNQVEPFCGRDASEAYATMNGRGAHSSNADEIEQNYQVGTLGN